MSEIDDVESKMKPENRKDEIVLEVREMLRLDPGEVGNCKILYGSGFTVLILEDASPGQLSEMRAKVKALEDHLGGLCGADDIEGP